MKNAAIKALMISVFNKEFEDETLDQIDVEFLYSNGLEYVYLISVYSHSRFNSLMNYFELRINNRNEEFTGNIPVDLNAVKLMLSRQFIKNLVYSVDVETVEQVGPKYFTYIETAVFGDNKLEEKIDLNVTLAFLKRDKF